MEQTIVTQTLENFCQSCPSKLEEWKDIMDTFNPR